MSFLYKNPMKRMKKEMVKDKEAWHTAVHGVGKELDTTEQLNNNKTW